MNTLTHVRTDLGTRPKSHSLERFPNHHTDATAAQPVGHGDGPAVWIEVTGMGATFGLVDRLLWDSPVGWAYAKVVPRSHAEVYADVAEVLALSADDDLLDIGCGPCAFLAEHAQQARTVTGLDPSRTMLREAEKRLSERISAGTARLVLAGSKHLPFDDGAFSAVTVITAPADLAEVHRVLRRGGRLVVVDELAATHASPPASPPASVPAAQPGPTTKSTHSDCSNRPASRTPPCRGWRARN